MIHFIDHHRTPSFEIVEAVKNRSLRKPSFHQLVGLDWNWLLMRWLYWWHQRDGSFAYNKPCEIDWSQLQCQDSKTLPTLVTALPSFELVVFDDRVGDRWTPPRGSEDWSGSPSTELHRFRSSTTRRPHHGWITAAVNQRRWPFFSFFSSCATLLLVRRTCG